MLGRIHSVDTFSTLDGPGIRTVIFMQGCYLRCRYCQNPDTWDYDAPSAKLCTPRDIMAIVERSRPYFAFCGGGLTVSGGEPMLQHQFVREVFRQCHDHGIHTAVDTSLYVAADSVEDILPYTNLVLADIKQMDPDKSIALVGAGNQRNLSNLRLVDASGTEIWIRYVIVPGYTDHADDLAQLSEFMRGLVNLTRIDLLPYHTLGQHKWQLLGLDYELGEVRPPSPQYLLQLQQYLEQDSGKKVCQPYE